ncbi:MAG: hypothetical protein NWE97_00420 [Candidatus Bathyarchaeota archaeon]|nr:hypothetical protein [Candidatus Bathyarchaeota archaeon]
MPEFFALLGIDLFLMLSLLGCLLDDRVPKALPYIYQVAALVGYGHLLISKDFFTIFGDYMRFWYCFIYLFVALANIIAINVYFAAAKRQWNLAKLWSGAVAFPTILISMFFVSHYTVGQGATLPLLPLQIGLVVSAAVIGISVSLFLSPEIRRSIKEKGRSIDKI